jgi:hypothetical protein
MRHTAPEQVAEIVAAVGATQAPEAVQPSPGG